MGVGWPISGPRAAVGKAGGGDVIRQRVDPDVHDMARIVGHRHAPIEGRSADREILEAALNESDDFVAVLLRRDELGASLVMRKQELAIGGEPEKVALLLD